MTVTNDLYQQVILEHNKKPRNFRVIEPSSHKAEGFNPICGDHMWVYLTINGQGVIEDVAFHGEGCAISKASASMMTTAVKGLTVDQAQKLFEDFQGLLKKQVSPDSPDHQLGKLRIFSGIWQYPARVKCAALAWHTLKGALAREQTVSTE